MPNPSTGSGQARFGIHEHGAVHADGPCRLTRTLRVHGFPDQAPQALTSGYVPLALPLEAGLSHMNFSAVCQPFGLSLSKPIPFLQQKEIRSLDRLRTNGEDRSIPYAIPLPLKGGGFERVRYSSGRKSGTDR